MIEEVDYERLGEEGKEFSLFFLSSVRGLKTLKIIIQAGFICKRLDSTSRPKEKRQSSPCKLLQHDSTN